MLDELRDIPNWLLRLVTKSGGGRIVSTKTSALAKQAHVPIPVINRSPTALSKSEIGNLTENEYRFWTGARVVTSRFGVCRYCNSYATDYDARRQHQRMTHCTTKLVAIFKLLLQAGKCVGCDETTTRTKWGVPLCSADCENEWKFNSYNVTQTIKAANIAALKRGIINET